MGKSTLFKLLTKQDILIANSPFATIDPIDRFDQPTDHRRIERILDDQVTAGVEEVALLRRKTLVEAVECHGSSFTLLI